MLQVTTQKAKNYAKIALHHLITAVSSRILVQNHFSDDASNEDLI